VWFEVSAHTNRLHYHLAPDGSRPLGLNVPMESLLLPEEGTLQQLAAAWASAWQQQLAEQHKEQQQQVELRVDRQPCPARQQAGAGNSQEQQAEQVTGVRSSPFFAGSPQRQQPDVLPLPALSLAAHQAELMQEAVTPRLLVAETQGGTPATASQPKSALAVLPGLLPLSCLVGTQQQQQQQQQQREPASTAEAHGSSQQPVLGCAGTQATASAAAAVSSPPALLQSVRRMLQPGGVHPRTASQQALQEQQGQHVHGSQPQQACAAGAPRLPTPAGLSLCVDSPRGAAAHDAGLGTPLDDVVIVIPASEDEDVVQCTPQQPQQQQPSQSQPQQPSQPSQPPQQPSRQLSQPPQQHEIAGLARAPPSCHAAPGFLTPAGLACLTLPLSPVALLELLRQVRHSTFAGTGRQRLGCLCAADAVLCAVCCVPQGAAFAADWAELRSVTRNRLVGRVLPPDLASAVEAATAAAAGAGAFGVGTTRYLRDVQEGDPNLPPGSRLVTVSAACNAFVASAARAWTAAAHQARIRVSMASRALPSSLSAHRCLCTTPTGASRSSPTGRPSQVCMTGTPSH
jgi:hypothetical protein